MADTTSPMAFSFVINGNPNLLASMGINTIGGGVVNGIISNLSAGTTLQVWNVSDGPVIIPSIDKRHAFLYTEFFK